MRKGQETYFGKKKKKKPFMQDDGSDLLMYSHRQV